MDVVSSAMLDRGEAMLLKTEAVGESGPGRLEEVDRRDLEVP
jgi:hypothetical protein